MTGLQRTDHVLIVNNTDESTSSGQLMLALGEAITRYAGKFVETRHLEAGGGKLRKVRVFLPSWSRACSVWNADSVIVQTSTVLVWQEIVLARLLGKQVRVIYWDAYPESFAPLGQQPGFGLLPYGWLERSLLRLCHAIHPPTSDYLPKLATFGLEKKARVFAMWPFTSILPSADSGQGSGDNLPLQICFAGAVNPIRGVESALRSIMLASNGPVELHTYGHRAPKIPEDLAEYAEEGRLRLCHHGFVPQSDVMQRLAEHDLALVSLSPSYAEPAFPSKTVSYICAGLPILYTGPRLPALEEFLTSTGTGIVLDERTGDLHEMASSVRARYRQAQDKALAELELNEARIAHFLE